jgi:hypothetical protein
MSDQGFMQQLMKMQMERQLSRKTVKRSHIGFRELARRKSGTDPNQIADAIFAVAICNFFHHTSSVSSQKHI